MKVSLTAVLSVFAATAFLCVPARAHSWYPKECCSGNDCAPVEKVAWLMPAGKGLPQLVVTSKIGTAIVPHDLPVRESKDGRMHVCIQDVWVVCLFIPPPM
jgi:hypothetical protein